MDVVPSIITLAITALLVFRPELTIPRAKKGAPRAAAARNSKRCRMKPKSDTGRLSNLLRVVQVFAAQAHERVVHPILIGNALDIGIVRRVRR
jgi:hypothetical protein